MFYSVDIKFTCFLFLDCKIFIVKCVFSQMIEVGDNALLEGASNPVKSNTEVDDATHPKITQQVHSF